MDFKSIMVNILMIGLFFMSLVYFAISFDNENQINGTLTDDPILNKAFGNLSKQLEDSTNQTEAQKEAFIEESRDPGVITAAGLIFRSIMNAASTLIGMIINIVNVFFSLLSETLGVSPLVTGTLFSIIIVVIILSIWKIYRLGE